MTAGYLAMGAAVFMAIGALCGFAVGLGVATEKTGNAKRELKRTLGPMHAHDGQPCYGDCLERRKTA